MADTLDGAIGAVAIIIAVGLFIWVLGYNSGKYVGQKQYASGIVNIVKTTNYYGEVEWERK